MITCDNHITYYRMLYWVLRYFTHTTTTWYLHCRNNRDRSDQYFYILRRMQTTLVHCLCAVHNRSAHYFTHLILYQLLSMKICLALHCRGSHILLRSLFFKFLLLIENVQMSSKNKQVLMRLQSKINSRLQ